ncbi:MAG: CRISPR-associated helicase Cas3' [Chloroflexi bacterium]|nr:CRISPR-associated helicase Cas3' [Chloroflexota bacterium]
MSLVLYPFQRQVADLLLSGRNVILQAPTGAGKTLAAMLPFLDAIEHARDFPHKCLYAVPMRVLANQFVSEYATKVRRAGRDDRIRVAIQTGEHTDDKELTATLTFATIDQVLSSFLLSPYSLSRRMSNLNAGAIVASYLVFDEFHLFDPVSTLPTTLEMLRMLRGIAPFLLMTATFSSNMLDGLANVLDAVVVPEDDTARQAMQSLSSQQKTRRYHVADSPLCADAVLARHQCRTLVVCNVVDRARALFEALRSHPDRGDAQVLLLHSRFLPEDRQRIEGQIRELFSKDGDPSGSWIVVATQVIEVGLDITCQTLHTELAPANAVLQRAGRCARYENEEGNVYIYTEALDAEGEFIDLTSKAWPYQDQLDEIARTLIEFQSCHGDTLTFSDEQAIVSAAHGPRDRSIVDGLTATREMHRRRMNAVMDGQQGGDAGNLIRAVSSRLVVVHDDPLAVAECPFAAEAFGLHPGTIYGLVNKWLEREWDLDLDGGYGVQALHDMDDVEDRGQSSYNWIPISKENKRDVAGSAMVLVHPALAGYDPHLGFVPDRGTGYRAKLAPAREAAQRGGYAYRLESYAEHARLVYHAFQGHAWPELAPAAARLERACGWPDGVMERAAHLVALLHDVGKLNQGWQDWVVRYQKAIRQPAPPGFYAHTDSDPTNPLHWEKQKSLHRKPPHAVEGAVAVAPLLASACQNCEPVFNAAFTAIARHHGAFTKQGKPYTLVTDAIQEVSETLKSLPPHLVGLDVELWPNEDPTELTVRDFVVNPGRDGEFLAYVLLARALRRSDQLGTMMGSP